MTTFYLIRHGEPNWNLSNERSLRGAMRDYVPLTDNGIQQAEQLVSNHPYLEDCELIISSPYTRSLQTAAIINTTLCKPIRVEFDLHEWTPDNWQANSVHELEELHRDYMKHNGQYPNGSTKLWETKESLIQRSSNVIKKYDYKSKVIVVCHGMIISTLMDLRSEDINLCGVYEYRLFK